MLKKCIISLFSKENSKNIWGISDFLRYSLMFLTQFCEYGPWFLGTIIFDVVILEYIFRLKNPIHKYKLVVFVCLVTWYSLYLIRQGLYIYDYAEKENVKTVVFVCLVTWYSLYLIRKGLYIYNYAEKENVKTRFVGLEKLQN